MRLGTLALCVLAGLLAAGCGGGDSELDQLGAMTCEEMLDERAEEQRSGGLDLASVSLYRYVAGRAEVPVETVLPAEENEGWTTWFEYYCLDDQSQSAEEAFDRAEEIVDEAGGPQAAQEKHERVATFEEDPPE